ncbi:MAG: hypothetical protein V2A73_00160, partial [Pseudomonadota bacterium]
MNRPKCVPGPKISAESPQTVKTESDEPHKGNQYAGWDPIFGAIQDLGIEQMRTFNEQHPYTTFQIEGRRIPLLALRFACEQDDDNGDDGVVEAQRQSLNGAPHSSTVFAGGHRPEDCGDTGAPRELGQVTELLQGVIVARWSPSMAAKPERQRYPTWTCL